MKEVNFIVKWGIGLGRFRLRICRRIWFWRFWQRAASMRLILLVWSWLLGLLVGVMGCILISSGRWWTLLHISCVFPILHMLGWVGMRRGSCLIGIMGTGSGFWGSCNQWSNRLRWSRPQQAMYYFFYICCCFLNEWTISANLLIYTLFLVLRMSTLLIRFTWSNNIWVYWNLDRGYICSPLNFCLIWNLKNMERG